MSRVTAQQRMGLRTLYLQWMLSINGRESLRGRYLFDQLSSISDQCHLGHVVLSNEDASRFTSPEMRDDILSYDQIKDFNPNLIYLEGGLFLDNEGTWRVPEPLVKELVTAGAVFIVADADI